MSAGPKYPASLRKTRAGTLRRSVAAGVIPFGLADLLYTWPMPADFPRYPLVNATTLRILASVVAGRPRSLRRDALEMVAHMHPPPRVHGPLPEACEAGIALTPNHYHRPGFGAWWIALAISAALPMEICWVMTAAWRYSDPLRGHTLTPVSRALFQRVARSYGFIRMPPMPPHPADLPARAAAVRALLRHVSTVRSPVIGLAIEGADSPDGGLGPPPPGVGRLLGRLIAQGMRIIPVGVYEAEGRLQIRFGSLSEPPALSGGKREIDRKLAEWNLRAIAALLPEPLRGPYA